MLISTYVVKVSRHDECEEAPKAHAAARCLFAKGIMKLHTYLNYGGNCKEAFQFYQQHLGGKITMMMTHGEQPGPSKSAADWKDAILYARMIIGETEHHGERRSA